MTTHQFIPEVQRYLESQKPAPALELKWDRVAGMDRSSVVGPWFSASLEVTPAVQGGVMSYAWKATSYDDMGQTVSKQGFAPTRNLARAHAVSEANLTLTTWQDVRERVKLAHLPRDEHLPVVALVTTKPAPKRWYVRLIEWINSRVLGRIQ